MTLKPHPHSPLIVDTATKEVDLSQYIQFTIYNSGDSIYILDSEDKNSNTFYLMADGATLTVDNHLKPFNGIVYLRAVSSQSVVYIVGVVREK